MTQVRFHACVTNSIVLFGTNISQELLEYAKAVQAEPKDLKEQLLKNVEAIFDEEAKEWLRDQITKY